MDRPRLWTPRLYVKLTDSITVTDRTAEPLAYMEACQHHLGKLAHQREADLVRAVTVIVTLNSVQPRDFDMNT